MCKTRVLIVEDEITSATLTKKYLVDSGYIVTSIISIGENAFEAIETERPDIVLMDILLQGKLDGIDTANQIRFRYDIPVVYITAYTDNDFLERARVTQPFGYILKPFEPGELRAVIEMAIYKHGVEKELKKKDEMRKRAQSDLECAFFDLVKTISRTFEFKDAYTAGHQKRVAELAREVGKAMNMCSDELDKLYVGGMLHDIGKVAVPGDILSKPSKLTNLEFLLIKEHPKTGYEIMEDVRLPWDIAEIILNHHEKLDGSGYPKGIGGDKIGIDTRIITICDVVDAMSSFRPYRPAKTRNEVLCELEIGKGTKYDGEIVDIVKSMIKGGYINP